MASNAAATSAKAFAKKLNIGKVSPTTTTFLLCDIQERFRPLMYNSETVISTARYLTSIAKELSIPVVGTQQYTKVFGPIVSDCFADGEEGLKKASIFEKKKFSMITEEVHEFLESSDDMRARSSFVLFGVESHVCVQQTCLDLLEMGKDVHVIVDGVSSQQPYDRKISLERMSSAGAFLTTAQSLAFMLMHSADHPNFKAVSKLTVNHMKLPNEFND
eukprot:CAMPEP_0184867898 /NCGR_PEP_ID=MMETSP0580-20130426/28180_1 /TAXON_ID=1118495 /ORGANISM="Dactyliosolen fragilissimus" /LENGTH=217 /DNA_ID=CAMNT_0027368409 /DNA_START=216 /DNA_END=869 /DNA_ORIENTATION=+